MRKFFTIYPNCICVFFIFWFSLCFLLCFLLWFWLWFCFWFCFWFWLWLYIWIWISLLEHFWSWYSLSIWTFNICTSVRARNRSYTWGQFWCIYMNVHCFFWSRIYPFFFKYYLFFSIVRTGLFSCFVFFSFCFVLFILFENHLFQIKIKEWLYVPVNRRECCS